MKRMIQEVSTEALSYAFFGGLSTLVDLGVYALTRTLLGYVMATLAGTVTGATMNYLLQKYVTFKEDSLPHGRQLTAYVVIFIISIGRIKREFDGVVPGFVAFKISEFLFLYFYQLW